MESVWDNTTWDYKTGVHGETDGISIRMSQGMPVPSREAVSFTLDTYGGLRAAIM